MKPVYQRTDAVNCFSSGLARGLSKLSGKPITEADIMLLGGGFKFQAGFDEYGFPEYIVQVIPACRQATKLLEVKLVNQSLFRSEVGFDDLPKLIKDYKQLFVWVNSRFMKYSEIYSKREGYIHAIVLEGYEAGNGQFRIFDPLIVDRIPMSCQTTLDAATLHLSMTTVVQGNELAPEMGQVFYIADVCGLTVPQDPRPFLRSQAQENLTEPRHRDALKHYHKSCIAALSSAHGDKAARRLFDHISPLFVLPTIFHLKRITERIGCSEHTKASLLEVESFWKQLAILALKFEATLDVRLLQRIDEKFLKIDEMRSEFWSRLLHDLYRAVSDA